MGGLTYEVGDSGRRIVVGLSQKIARLQALEGIMPELATVIYSAEREWFESEGEGSWPHLSAHTVQNKVSQGLAEPERPLYAHGNLFESVTSPSGPYSYVIPMFDGIVIGVSWTAAKALSAGTRTSGYGHHTVIPSRPIWPPVTSAYGLALKQTIGQFIMDWVSGRQIAPAWPGAHVRRAPAGGYGSYKGGQFVPAGYTP